MSNKRNPYIRVPLVIAVLVMLYFMPTREFLKRPSCSGYLSYFCWALWSRQPSLFLGLERFVQPGLLLVTGGLWLSPGASAGTDSGSGDSNHGAALVAKASTMKRSPSSNSWRSSGKPRK